MRTVYLHSSCQIAIEGDRQTVITPTLQIARSLNVPHQSLESLAQQVCHRHGITVAPILLAHRTLQTAVKTAIDPTDIEGTARAYSKAVKSILRAGIDLESLASVQQPKVRKLAHLTRTYQQQLADRNTIDSAQLLWRASRLKCDRQPLFIYGYFQPRPDRLKFIDAIAGDGSAMVLPCTTEDAFADNRAAIDWLEKRGWEIVEDSSVENAPAEKVPTEFDRNSALPIPNSTFLNPISPVSEFRIPNSEFKQHTYPHSEAEVRGVLSQVKQLLTDGVAARDIVLVARDDAAYGPMLLDVAWEYELPVRAFYPVPLTATRLGAWVRLLLEVVGSNFLFEATAKLLSHPLAGGKLQGVWAQVRSQHPQGFRPWQKFAKPAGIDLSVLKWKKKDTRSNWVQRLRDVFDGFEIRQHCAGRAREIVAYYKFLEGLEASMQPATERLGLAEFTREIADSLRLLSVPAQPGRGGVELHVPQSVAGTRYAHVFVLGMAEGMFPAPLEDDPVLDFFTRKQLCRQGLTLESIAQVTRREALSFRFLLPVATHTLTFSYPQRMGKAEMLPSPYLTPLALQSQTPEVASASLEEARKVALGQYVRALEASEASEASRALGKRYSEHLSNGSPTNDALDLNGDGANGNGSIPNGKVATLKNGRGNGYVNGNQNGNPNSNLKTIETIAASLDDPLFSHIVAAWQVEQHRESANPHDEYDGAIAIEIDPAKRVLSASQLTQLGQCGFKWFAGHLLHLDELDEAETELSGRTRGRLYHKTLELALQMAREKPDLREGMLASLEAAFAQAEESERLGEVSAWEVRRPEHLDRLRRTIAHDSFLLDGAEVLATERTFVGTWYGLKVEGTVDRIDDTPDGLHLVEYKNISSKPTAAKDADGKAKLEIQLPLYTQVAAEALFPDRPVAKAYYYSISKQKAIDVKTDNTELAEFVDRIKGQLRQGDYRVEPDVDGKACNYCAQDVVCRKGPRLHRKQV